MQKQAIGRIGCIGESSHCRVRRGRSGECKAVLTSQFPVLSPKKNLVLAGEWTSTKLSRGSTIRERLLIQSKDGQR
ncbi:hypothetical protein M2298_004583 [Brevibacillus sp. 1238]|nr:hypothetical protein [Brevibacillus sp. 1238]RNB95931.1 hypothetical protein EDM60_09535 [Brevibacillus parabrevis]HBZ83131.1 hypothetical protein [Brevibacillus sp.]